MSLMAVQVNTRFNCKIHYNYETRYRLSIKNSFKELNNSAPTFSKTRKCHRTSHTIPLNPKSHASPLRSRSPCPLVDLLSASAYAEVIARLSPRRLCVGAQRSRRKVSQCLECLIPAQRHCTEKWLTSATE